jgi:hypothetical protein
MPTKAPPHVKKILAQLRDILAQPNQKGIKLRVADNDFVEEGGWLNIIVSPVDPNVEAYDYVKELNEAEKELRKRLHRQRILLVPAVPA